MSVHNDTIIAQATPPGKGGVGIIRISGQHCQKVANQIIKQPLKSRVATFTPFYDLNNNVIDQGIAIFFKSPNSFTGEDILELQGHGGQVLLDLIIQNILKIPDIRMAKPGEFTERAFLNDKIDLTQAEAIADLINASSIEAAKSAMNSLQGEFSKKINELVKQIIYLRVYVEAAIDFPEEEIDFLNDGKVKDTLNKIVKSFENLKSETKQGILLKDGMKVVIAGKPNAGKSSILNKLSGKDSAIVTDIEGTTRDIVKEHIHIDGMPLHIIDTAGLRDTEDKVEQLGIQKAWKEIESADKVLLILDSSKVTDVQDSLSYFKNKEKLTLILNKSDLKENNVQKLNIPHEIDTISVSAKTGDGINNLKKYLKNSMGYTGDNESNIIARQRHLDSINNAFEHLINGKLALEELNAGELLAEELKISQSYLDQITGKFSSDDLLTEIFSSFCIGK
ncbi:tRNA uridine-5-carboxymethylaminomethyl(34) synthesis GTPase MnmE [Paraphotobacterium marinum]|uniref:tRNA modification GTPase MnmE n=1 Tax=Paraphotobacterium marinum TaxID=1755811 RepID=A0A220VCR7_9GAMM|nr:tRNA uridine-5-carboxymethylaminomethyl(34) synthesis GTPase MnmE [Paraphotobacterium marinum]ASK78135.1 tRNA uridine-5-carboxymethylaminomethyl(34) synthesis GTPase MnmE [Paraphotobacterium marinum]